MAAARVTRTDYHAPFRAKLYPSAPPAAADGNGNTGRGNGVDDGLDIVRDNWDDSSDEEEEAEGRSRVQDGGNPLEGAGRGDETADNEQGRSSQGQNRQEDTDQDQGVDKEVEGHAEGDTAGSSLDITPSGAPDIAPAAAAALAPPAAAPSGKKSKWGNSAIKGRLSRPSDGRATTVEQEAAARRERIEKLR